MLFSKCCLLSVSNPKYFMDSTVSLIAPLIFMFTDRLWFPTLTSYTFFIYYHFIYFAPAFYGADVCSDILSQSSYPLNMQTKYYQHTEWYTPSIPVIAKWFTNIKKRVGPNIEPWGKSNVFNHLLLSTLNYSGKVISIRKIIIDIAQKLFLPPSFNTQISNVLKKNLPLETNILVPCILAHLVFKYTLHKNYGNTKIF